MVKLSSTSGVSDNSTGDDSANTNVLHVVFDEVANIPYLLAPGARPFPTAPVRPRNAPPVPGSTQHVAPLVKPVSHGAYSELENGNRPQETPREEDDEDYDVSQVADDDWENGGQEENENKSENDDAMDDNRPEKVVQAFIY
jgi:hypothetical protein